MVNAVYHDKPFGIHQSYTFEFIKAVSDTVLDMINTTYHEKPLVFIGATFREKLVCLHRVVDETDS